MDDTGTLIIKVSNISDEAVYKLSFIMTLRHSDLRHRVTKIFTTKDLAYGSLCVKIETLRIVPGLHDVVLRISDEYPGLDRRDRVLALRRHLLIFHPPQKPPVSVNAAMPKSSSNSSNRMKWSNQNSWSRSSGISSSMKWSNRSGSRKDAKILQGQRHSVEKGNWKFNESVMMYDAHQWHVEAENSIERYNLLGFDAWAADSGAEDLGIKTFILNHDPNRRQSAEKMARAAGFVDVEFPPTLSYKTIDLHELQERGELAGNFDMGTETQQKKYVAHALDYRNAAISLLHYIENSKNLHDENGRAEGSEGEEVRRVKL
eukprot:CAMPEP_0179449268 /NCGR_PEP_ID=MMETSP0799-20121207/33256_1 /TAXON_ID=46947 /ORGANISM="Geminigera cryophila, Strain CCMP2564" /LENGTH=316 /DNA_ID=CAMNT_0021242225 /DNA_START=478 /DNA_END=1425 /DNA_ORIENTATION=+